MKNIFGNKKGQTQFTIQSIGTIAIALLVVAVIIGLNSTILSKLVATTDDDTTSHDNESLTWAGNATPIALAENRIVGGSHKLYNNGTIINKGLNYTSPSNLINFTNSYVLWNGTNRELITD